MSWCLILSLLWSLVGKWAVIAGEWVIWVFRTKVRPCFWLNTSCNNYRVTIITAIYIIYERSVVICDHSSICIKCCTLPPHASYKSHHTLHSVSFHTFNWQYPILISQLEFIHSYHTRESLVTGIKFTHLLCEEAAAKIRWQSTINTSSSPRLL